MHHANSEERTQATGIKARTSHTPRRGDHQFCLLVSPFYLIVLAPFALEWAFYLDSGQTRRMASVNTDPIDVEAQPLLGENKSTSRFHKHVYVRLLQLFSFVNGRKNAHLT